MFLWVMSHKLSHVARHDVLFITHRYYHWILLFIIHLLPSLLIFSNLRVVSSLAQNGTVKAPYKF